MGQRGSLVEEGALALSHPHGAVRRTTQGVLSRVAAPPSQRSVSRKKPRPCKCGCGGDTGTRHRKWIVGHYDFVTRSDIWERTRRAEVHRKRREKLLAIVRSLGPRMTERELIAALTDVERRGYLRGYTAKQMHQRKVEYRAGEDNRKHHAVCGITRMIPHTSDDCGHEGLRSAGHL